MIQWRRWLGRSSLTYTVVCTWGHREGRREKYITHDIQNSAMFTTLETVTTLLHSGGFFYIESQVGSWFLPSCWVAHSD